MPDQSRKQTPYDQFNFEIPQKFPQEAISAAAANAIVNSETWTDLNQDVTEILAGDIEAACEYLEQHGGSATPPKLHDAHKTSVKC